MEVHLKSSVHLLLIYLFPCLLSDSHAIFSLQGSYMGPKYQDNIDWYIFSSSAGSVHASIADLAWSGPI